MQARRILLELLQHSYAHATRIYVRATGMDALGSSEAQGRQHWPMRLLAPAKLRLGGNASARVTRLHTVEIAQQRRPLVAAGEEILLVLPPHFRADVGRLQDELASGRQDIDL